MRALKYAAMQEGAGESELSSIDRLHEGTALKTDVERLEPLAKFAGLDWRKLYPEAYT